MKPGTRLGLVQRQRLALTPAVRQSLEVLRLPAATLSERIAEELGRNPLLVRAGGGRGATADFLPDLVAAEPGLLERLHAQIGLMPLDAPVRQAAEYLAGTLRDDGYLDATPAEIAAETGQPVAVIEAGLAALQACDPPGVGARDLAECLALQLLDRGLDRPIADAVVGMMADFAAARWARLEIGLGLPRARLQEIAALLPGLVPHPVAGLSAPVQALRPDLVARFRDGEIVVELARDALPRLRLDHALLQRSADDAFVAECRARAEALIAALRQRGATLLRIGRHLAEVQAGFFSQGEAALQPLSRRQLAEALGLHPATVGRAVADKAIDVEGRLFPLSVFFSAPLPGPGGTMAAGAAVRRRIAALIAAEPAAAPLSDARLCAILRGEGVDIARRTVAKYREALRLPSSADRRRLYRTRQPRRS